MTRPPARLATISSSRPCAKPEAERKTAKSSNRNRRHQFGKGARRVERIGGRLSIIFLEAPRRPPSWPWRASRSKRRDRDSFRRESRRESYEYLRYFPADLRQGERGPQSFPAPRFQALFRGPGIGRRRAWRPARFPSE